MKAMSLKAVRGMASNAPMKGRSTGQCCVVIFAMEVKP
jgi:hypothetical protein